MSLEKKRWFVVIGALMVQIILGTIYAFSVFVGPLENEFGWHRTTTQWAFSIALLTFAVMMIPAGRMQDKIGPRKVATIGGILLGFSFILASLIVSQDRPWTLYLTYGIIGGAGIGFAYVCPISSLIKWFPEKKGLMTGIAVAGFGAGALFFAGPASALLMPPDSADPLSIYEIILIGAGFIQGPGHGIGWETFFLIHGLVCALVVIVGASFLNNPPVDWKPEGWNPEQHATQSKFVKDIGWRDMLNTPLAAILWITFIFGATSGLMAIGQWKPMMKEVLGGKTFAPEWLGVFGRFFEPVAVLALFNALGRIFWGKISDLIDRPRAMMIMYMVQGISFMMLISVQSPVYIFIASAMVGMNFGGNFALFPSATADYFGTKNLGVNYGWMFTAYGVAGIIGPVVGGILYDAQKSYLEALIFAGILCFIAAVTSLLVWNISRTQNQLDQIPPRAR